MNITLNTTMGEILGAYPAAKLGLFRRYHIGGCTACGYKLDDTLGQVCIQYNIKDSLETIVTVIRESSAAEAKLLILPTMVASVIQPTAMQPSVNGPQTQCRETPGSNISAREISDRIIDVRTREEFESGHIPGAQLLTVELTFEALDSWPKNAPIVFYSNTGQRGLEKASYFMAYGFTNVRNMAGGLSSWPGEIERSEAAIQAAVPANL